MLFNALALFSLLSVGTAHFTLKWPTARGFSDSTAGNFPCGGFDGVKTPRTKFPLKNGPVQLRMEHTQTNVEVLLAIGDEPGGNFNIVLRRTHAQEGLGDYCVGGLNIPSDLNVSDGTPATIQVVTNGDPSGGLYQCADVTLTTATLEEDEYGSHCNNQSGVKVTSENIRGNPNETVSEEGPSPTNGGDETSPSPTGGMAAHQTAVTWLMGVIGVVGFALL